VRFFNFNLPQTIVSSRMKSDRGVLRQVIFDRRNLMIIYAFITIAVGIQVILHRSVGIGAAALVACAVCLISSCTLVSCFLARHEQQYSAKNLGITAVISASLTLVGLALMRWSGFRLILYGNEISGIQWALVGSVVGFITAKSELLK
jgi:hypothetical protein